MKTERLFVWCGLAGTTLVFVGVIVGHLLPPPSPNESAVQITNFYRQHVSGLRWGSILICFGAALLAPWIGVVTKHLKAIKGHGAIAAYCQLALGALLIFELILPLVILQVVLFRLNRPVVDTQTLSDLFLIIFISPVYTFIVELAVTAVAILRDDRTAPVFPRWIAGVNLATAVLSVPSIVVIFVKSGPFTWNGALGFWVPAFAFATWVLAMTLGLLRPTPTSALGT